MYTKGSGLTPELVERLRHSINPDTGKPYNQSEIADMYGVSRQAISKMKRRGRFSETPREIARKAFPWRVPAELQGSYLNKRIADHGEYMATGGKGMQEWKLKELAWFYDRLSRDKGYVVEYDPAIPPNEHATHGGFEYRRRRKSDGDLIIRVNQHTVLTEDGKKIWRMPPRRPTV